MIQEAIILAGGLGTRLREEVSELPKSMAPINGLPFLKYQLDFLAKHQVQKVHLAVGYLSEVITNYFGDSYNGIELIYSFETEPLGTGGAISQALEKTDTETILILNGDTMFQVELEELLRSHQNSNANFSMALKPMENFERYGVVQMDDKHKIIGFEEKQFQKSGIINGGIYLINKSVLNKYNFDKKYSFEREFLESKFQNLQFNGYVSNGYFLDIGIPSDYHKAQEDFKQYNDWNIDKSWTLFLDRDGVINTLRKNNYVKSIEEFEFIGGVLSSIPSLNKIFGKVVVVTNQQCVGKEIINETQLNGIHQFMLTEIEKEGGTLDAVYFAPQLITENSKMRKPNTGMADLAKKEFPEIDFKKSIIVGDSHTDMEFGQKKGMKTVYINPALSSKFDRCFASLEDFTKSVS